MLIIFAMYLPMLIIKLIIERKTNLIILTEYHGSGFIESMLIFQVGQLKDKDHPVIMFKQFKQICGQRGTCQL